MKNSFDFKENRFFVEGEGGIKYTYNNGHIAKDLKLAATNFLKALERIPSLIGSHKSYAEKAAVDLPVLKEVVNNEWRKEEELRKFKTELSSLERKIQLSLSDKHAEHEEKDVIQINDNHGIARSSANTPKVEQRFKVS